MNLLIEKHYNNEIGYDNCLWHGGKLFTIKYNNDIYELYARGIVDCRLIAKTDYTDEDGNFYQKDSVIVRIKDKNDSGIFRDKMEYYIKNDTELSSLLRGEHPLFSLELDNHNWLELTHYDKDGNVEDIDLNNVYVSDAIKEVVEDIKEKDNECYYAIYCRTANYDDRAIEMQKQICLNKLIKEKGKNVINRVIYYIDNGKNGRNFYNSEFVKMLNDMYNNKIIKIYTYEISRLSRNINGILELKEILDNNYSDAYIVLDNKYFIRGLGNILTLKDLSKKLEEESKNIKIHSENKNEIDLERDEY